MTDSSALAHRVRKEYEHLIWYYRLRVRPALIVLDDELVASWGLWCPRERVIKLSPQLFYLYSWSIAVEVLKHEVAHQIVTEVFQCHDLHGPYFKRAASMLAMADWSQSASLGRDDLTARSQNSLLTPDEARLIRRAEKLLALGHSSNPHEAKLAMQRVHELYLNHNLEAIKRRTIERYCSSMIALRRKRLGVHYTMIASILTDYYFVDVIQCDWYCPHDQVNYKGFDLMGARENVAMAEYVFSYLERAMASAWRDYQKSQSERDRGSFLTGFLTGFRAQLAAVKSPGTSFSHSTSQIVRLRDPLLMTYTKARYPRTHRTNYRAESSHGASFANGHQQGKSTVVKRPLEAGSSQDGPTRALR